MDESSLDDKDLCMLGQWYPLVRYFNLFQGRGYLTEVARSSAPDFTWEPRFRHHRQLLLLNTSLTTVYVYTRGIMAGTSTMQGEGSSGELTAPHYPTIS
jgi:hypothetical protein